MHLETLYDAAHDPKFLDARRCIMLPARASDLQDVHFVDPMDFVGFSKALPHARPVQYGQAQSADAKTASSLTFTLASPPKPPSAVIEPLSLATAAAAPKVALQDFSAIKKLGSGASGVVYLVRNDLTQKLFALKKMEKEFLDPEAIGRLVQEQRMLRKVRGHDNIVGLEASFHDQQNFFLVMVLRKNAEDRLALKAMKDHQFFQTINWEMLFRGEAEAERKNDGFKIPSAEPVVPDSFPPYAFQSELFVNIALFSAKSSSSSTASDSSVDSSTTSVRLPERFA
ncbi:hypothetical protein EWM64_g750 [Hericium alpestre]|uniref:non-specific serine/threonine protein kinase n=1 Tax=Hericium alpestre TaxID=135208 RepID=A0A4Z0A974_9AGAM|nr:hypothetical protein EWM64_g750 [Hericium alpestre]